MHHRGREFEMWPPGLQSLRHLAIGVDTGTGQPPDRHHQYTPLLLAKMLNLPNLESFYLCGFANMHQDELDYLYDGSVLTPECSSLRHLYLENFWGIDREIWEPILSACKTQVSSHSAMEGFADEIIDNSSLALHFMARRLRMSMNSSCLRKRLRRTCRV